MTEHQTIGWACVMKKELFGCELQGRDRLTLADSYETAISIFNPIVGQMMGFTRTQTSCPILFFSPYHRSVFVFFDTRISFVHLLAILAMLGNQQKTHQIFKFYSVFLQSFGSMKGKFI